MNIDAIFYNFPKITIELFYYNTGTLDFKSNVPSVTPSSVPLKAVELPLQVSKEWVRKVSEVKYEKIFLFKYNASRFANDIIKPNFYINTISKDDVRSRYNVKDCVALDQGYYLATCVAAQGEKVR